MLKAYRYIFCTALLIFLMSQAFHWVGMAMNSRSDLLLFAGLLGGMLTLVTGAYALHWIYFKGEK